MKNYNPGNATAIQILQDGNIDPMVKHWAVGSIESELLLIK